MSDERKNDRGDGGGEVGLIERARRALRRDYPLYKIHEASEVLRYNKFILTGYRSMLTIRQGLMSVLHVHNESGNIWTHGGAALLFIYFSICEYDPRWAPFEALLFLSQVFAVCCLFFGSCTYHTLQCVEPCDKKSYGFWLTCDLIGILLGITLSSVRRIWYALMCHPALRLISLSSVGGAVVFVLLMLVSGWAHKSVIRRILTFLVLFLSLHVSTVLEYISDTGAPLGRFFNVLTLATVGVGAAFNFTRFPERFLPPSTVDLFGNSHQIWHIIVVVGVFFQWFAITAEYEWAQVTECTPTM